MNIKCRKSIILMQYLTILPNIRIQGIVEIKIFDKLLEAYMFDTLSGYVFGSMNHDIQNFR